MFKSILFGAFCFMLWSLVAVGSLFLGGCGGGEDTTVVLNMPAEQCIAGHHEACWCENGATGYQVCRDDGMAYGHCQCTELPTVDAGAETSVEDSGDTSCGPNQPVGHVIGSNCCDDGSTGYMVCQASGLYEGCWGCQLESDAGTDADAEIDSATHDCPPYNAQSSLLITESALGHPEPTIVIGGKDVWVPTARYQACVQGNEDVKLSKIGIQWRTQNGAMSAESFSLVGVAHQGNVIGTAQFDNNDPYGVVDVELSNGITIAKGDCQPIELWAKFAPVVSSMQAGGEWSHQPRSGKSVSLRIGESVPFYGTDAYCNTTDYLGKLFVHARGLTTSEKIFADEGAPQPNFMTVRKSKPVVVPQALTSTVLINGDQELARFVMSAYGDGSVAIKQIMFTVDKSVDVNLVNFRFYRGAIQLPTNEYFVTNAVTGADLYADSMNGNTAVIAVSLVGEEVVSGSGNVYSLRATVGYMSTGKSVSVRFKADFPAAASPVTGYLLNNDSYAPYAASPRLFNVGDYSGCNSGGPCWHSLGTFVNADISEIPHSSQTDNQGGSRDWSTDQHIWELTAALWNISN